ncbi:MAG: sensor histidine kinase efflux regulator BaeS [Acinetobacter sp.]|nr:sensor histidine kinase efflux regulator BaeS [Acinetobacter sp.]
MKKIRFTIATRLFSAVLFVMLLTAGMSLFVQHNNMQKNFARYVADVEMEKLDHFVDNLEDIYAYYHDWGDAIQGQILEVTGQADPEDYDQLSRWWLRRQYDIALQQVIFKQESTQQLPQRQQNGVPVAPPPERMQRLTPAQLKQWQQNLPTAYHPFEGLSFPLKQNSKWMQVLQPDYGQPNAHHLAEEIQPHVNAEQNSDSNMNVKSDKKAFISIPDRLGLSSRLSLYDANKQFIVGDFAPIGDVSYRTLYYKGKVVGYLGLKATLRQDDAKSISFFSNQRQNLLMIAALSVLISLVLAIFLAMSFKRPIQQLVVAARELIKGNYQYRTHSQRNDELGDLSQTVNQLAHILDQHEQSRRQWVADTSHELKTPLSVLQAQIEAMQDGIRKPTPEHFEAMQRQVQSLKKLTQDLADLAQADVQQLKCYASDVSAWALVQQEVAQFHDKFAQTQLQIQLDGVDAMIHVDVDRFKQIVVNLLQNSTRYTLPEGQIHIHSHIEQQHWVLYVDDSPLGVDDEQLARLGERFYRVDDSRTRSTGGSGLGLALSCKIAHILGGTLSFAHSPLGGLRCRLSFPVVDLSKS